MCYLLKIHLYTPKQLGEAAKLSRTGGQGCLAGTVLTSSSMRLGEGNIPAPLLDLQLTCDRSATNWVVVPKATNRVAVPKIKREPYHRYRYMYYQNIVQGTYFCDYNSFPLFAFGHLPLSSPNVIYSFCFVIDKPSLS